MRATPILLLFVFSSALLCADDLTTRDGKVYHDYKILGHDAGYVTIMYSDGGGKIPLSELPDDLQKKYGYDKAQADAFVQATIQQDRQDRQAIANEAKQHQAQMAAQAAVETSASRAPAVVAPGAGTNPPPVTGAPNAVAVATPDSPTAPVPSGTAYSPEQNIAPDSMTDEQRQAAMGDLQKQIAALKARILQMKTDEARQRALANGNGQQPGGQNPVNAGQITTPFDGQLARLRTQLHLVKISAPPQPKPKLTDEQIEGVKQKIHKLQDDVHDMQQELDKRMAWDPKSFDYPDMIEDENDQIAELQAELPATVADTQDADASEILASIQGVDIPATGPLSAEDVQAIQQKIKDLNADILFMTKEQNEHGESQTVSASGTVITPPHGGFTDKIAEETKEISVLRKRLQQTK